MLFVCNVAEQQAIRTGLQPIKTRLFLEKKTITKHVAETASKNKIEK
jgi:uncharacterized membrane-anchored protein YhcB (DUF1043 family)